MDLKGLTFLFRPGSAQLKPFPHVLLFGARSYREADRSFRGHRNDGIELIYVVDGRVTRLVDGERVVVRRGEVSVTYPWQYHSGEGEVRDRGAIAYLVVAPQRFTRAGALKLGPWSPLRADEERSIGRLLVARSSAALGPMPRVGERLRELHDEITRPRLGYVSRVNGILAGLIVDVARRHAHPSDVPVHVPLGISRSLEQMRSDPARAWSVGELASRAGMKPTAFGAWVSKATGLPPMKYLLSLRIDRARQMLAAGDASMTEIAFAAGFSSSQHFSNLFRKQTGFTPTEYRARATTPTARAASSSSRRRASAHRPPKPCRWS
jgi:AraC family L-rhamnose operon regulatory protein RhaS